MSACRAESGGSNGASLASHNDDFTKLEKFGEIFSPTDEKQKLHPLEPLRFSV
jgi:hypothetical protein